MNKIGIMEAKEFKYKVSYTYSYPDGCNDTYEISLRKKIKDEETYDNIVIGKIGVSESHPLYGLTTKMFINQVILSRIHNKADLTKLRSTYPRHEGAIHYFTFSTADYGLPSNDFTTHVIRAINIADDFVRFADYIKMKGVGDCQFDILKMLKTHLSNANITCCDTSSSTCITIKGEHSDRPVIIYENINDDIIHIFTNNVGIDIDTSKVSMTSLLTLIKSFIA